MTYLTLSTDWSFLGFKEVEKSYKVITWLAPEDCNRELKKSVEFIIGEGLEGR